ncbi:MAG: hybrid sensor histidine kinase/response regulator [bacterium]
MQDKNNIEKLLIDELIELSCNGSFDQDGNSAKANQNLKDMMEKYRLIVDNANEAIFVVQDDIVRFANPKTEDILGIKVNKITFQDLLNLFHPDDMEIFAQNYSSLISGEKTRIQYNSRIIDRYGNTKWVQVFAVLIKWEGKNAVLNFLSDITERHKTEEEIIKADKLESVGLLAGGIAHDFNNILTAVLGNVSLAKMYVNPGDKIYERLVEAEKASLRAKELTQQLLTFSSGGAPIVKTMPIEQLLRDAVNFALSGSNVRCDFFITNKLKNVDIDESQIRQVINNIIINAIQAMPEGGVIKVYAENTTIGSEYINLLKPGKYVKITIEDHGIGIPENNLPRIFDPYFTTKQKKSGLGLTSAYSIIKNHGGYITVESQVGVGTKCHVYLPASSVQFFTEENVKKEEHILGKGKVLVMDDEEIIRDLAYEALTSLGYEVVTAFDGEEAIKIYKSALESGEPFDVVILDLTIHGGMGGKDTIKHLIEIDPNVKAIVSSGYSNDPVMANYKDYGFIGVIPKPYQIRDLGKIINEVIEKKN